MPSPVLRSSLISETATALRACIRRGDFGEFLVPERSLSAELGISRPTLRAALKQLAEEDLVATSGRQGWKILHRPKRSKSHRGAIVRILQNETPSSLLNEHLRTQEFLAEHLRGPGVEFRVETAPACFSSRPDRALEHLIRSRPATLWLLYLTTEPIQRWFQDRGLPCIILGSRYSGINFPAVDQDYRAACRHATGLLLAKGHVRLGSLGPMHEGPGDSASLAGFTEGILQSQRKGVLYQHATHDQTAPRICRAVDELLRRNLPPTGWLILNPRVYLTVAAYLASKRIQVGKDISLICRNSDSYFQDIIPAVAHYRRNMQQFNRRILLLIQRGLAGEQPQDRQWLLPSEFCDGPSLQTRRI